MSITPYGRAPVPLADFEAMLAGVRPTACFDPAALETLNRLSRFLLAHPVLRAEPAWVALGYWLRKAAVTRLREDFEARLPASVVAAPRGLAFHLPPRNVDTLFLYSWALSFLVGNANLVRLPSVPPDAVRVVLDALLPILEETGAARGNAFVSYEADGAETARLSLHADLRLIWGGDEKIRRISVLPAKPRCVTLSFADRFSFSLIRTAAYLALDEAGRNELARLAYNDIYLFDQMACSSARLFVWWSDGEDDHAARRDFGHRLAAEARSRSYAVMPHTALSKFAAANRSAIDLRVEAVSREGGTLTDVALAELADIREESPGGGFLYSVSLRDLDELADFVGVKDQSLSYFGLSREECLDLARRLATRGIDRIVPIGQSLNFDSVWDGFDLLSAMSRAVRVL
jgi:hypothetical protein